MAFAGVEELLNERPVRLLIPLAVATLVLQVLGFYDLRHDDAYITFRYGMNLAGGNGPVFNLGEHIMGSSTPGLVLVSAALYALVGQSLLPSAMSILGCIGWTAQAVAAFYVLRRATGVLGAALMSLVVAGGAAGSADWVALETNLAVALALWGLVCAREQRWQLSMALVATAGLVRADAHLLGCILASVCLWKLRARCVRPALIYLGIALPWPLFATLYYGSAFPQSAFTKFHRVDLPTYADHIYNYMGYSISTDAPAYLVWFLCAAGAVLLLRRDRTLWPLHAWAAIHLAAYLHLRPFVEHTWHLYPAVLVFILTAYGGSLALTQIIDRRALRFTLYALCTAMLLVIAAGSFTKARDHHRAYWNGARDTAYRQVAEYLLLHARPGDEVAGIEVGTIAYWSGQRMWDVGGLVSIAGRTNFDDVRWFVTDPTLPIPPLEPIATFSEAVYPVALYDARELRRIGYWR